MRIGAALVGVARDEILRVIPDAAGPQDDARTFLPA
jgi:hypothetical protein